MLPMAALLRSTLGVAVLSDHIYAVGGFDGSAGLNTAEVSLKGVGESTQIITQP